ncbi:MAG: dCTP deaminase [Patescibacteria group bacterium]|nr:dCTP deaminase [Patescibacteria group bacterium]MDE2116512.1 dCTP deaminase [Patescibacteria group bacterium]
MILSDRDIHESLKRGELLVVAPNNNYPFDPATQVQPASIDLRLDNRFSKFPADISLIDLRKLEEINKQLCIFYANEAEPILLEPHEVLFAQIYEQIAIPGNTVGRIVGRSRFARLGLSITSTGDFLNPEFEGAMPLQLVNHGSLPIVIYPYISICQLILTRTQSDVLIPYSKRGDTPYNHEVHASPSVLHRDPVLTGDKATAPLQEQRQRTLVSRYLEERRTDLKEQQFFRLIFDNSTHVSLYGNIDNTDGQLFLGRFEEAVSSASERRGTPIDLAVSAFKNDLFQTNAIARGLYTNKGCCVTGEMRH